MIAPLTVVGGGIIGLSIAWRCVQRGLDVTVHDAGSDDGAWYAAAGMLAAAGETAFGQEALTELLAESARRWAGFAAELAEATGRPLGYDRTGALDVALTSDDLAEARRLWGYREKSVPHTASELRELEPALSPRIRGGAAIPDDHQADPRKTVAALRALLGDRIVSRRVAVLPAGRTVVAAGIGTAELTGLPVRPVKGLVLRLRGEPGLLRHVINGYVDGRHVYLVPRRDGEVIVGATQEERTDFTVTAGAVLDLLRSAVDLVPDLAEHELTETVVRHRPATPDNAPLLGRWHDDVFVAAGHHRNGVLLAPITADLIAGLVADGRSDPLLAAFAPGRFA
ncbi:glycine oxidase ThiO [Actinoplanes sp. N902-109]|uniref:glycine oxidase ThiO n=1 Tax=Actinoplanes sp. (strain N902-109) TaxID=649831 RepID=UPI0003295EB7|nr:glycine oxidase ThiO [Actinoplanes sp. N902-109]AGL14473.1 glycine oxidase ThiO [Actinoplanes sp. N902-109]